MPFCVWRLFYRISLTSASLYSWSDMPLSNWKHYFDLIPQFKSFSWNCVLYDSTFLAVHYCLFQTEVLTLRMRWIRVLVQNEPLQDTVDLKLEDVMVLVCHVAIELTCLMCWILIKTKQCQAGFNFCVVSSYFYRIQTSKKINLVFSCAYILN